MCNYCELTCYITNEKLKDMRCWIQKSAAQFKKGELYRKFYTDPDAIYSDKDSGYYRDLVKFLNKRETQLQGKLQGHYTYCFRSDEPAGIRVCEGENQLFTLRSDQFGFSAPKKVKDLYPYTFYMEKSKTFEGYCNVARWIAETRTLGGSFLWPYGGRAIQCNQTRGGRVGTNARYYIQDRVDLTLLEMKHFYDAADYPNDRLRRYYYVRAEENKVLPMGKWLEHFKNFETYVEFFCFMDFVDPKTGFPYNLLSENMQECLADNHEHKPEITEDTELEPIFNSLSERILKRSKSMEDYIHGKVKE